MTPSRLRAVLCYPPVTILDIAFGVPRLLSHIGWYEWLYFPNSKPKLIGPTSGRYPGHSVITRSGLSHHSAASQGPGIRAVNEAARARIWDLYDIHHDTGTQTLNAARRR